MDEIAELMRQRIATRLTALKLTPITAATKAGLPRDTLRNIFRQNGSSPRLDTLLKIADALETTVAYLVGETAYPKNDYSDEDSMSAARTAISTARPIPIVGTAEWGLYERLKHNDEYDSLIFFNVPGFEAAPLMAVYVADEHADLEYPVGTCAIFVWRDVAGLRNGDHVICLKVRGNDGEYTIRELVTERLRLADGTASMNGGLASLNINEEKYPSVSFRDAYTGPDGSKLMVIGVVVAYVGYVGRVAEPGMFPGIEENTMTVEAQLARMAPRADEPSESGS